MISFFYYDPIIGLIYYSDEIKPVTTMFNDSFTKDDWINLVMEKGIVLMNSFNNPIKLEDFHIGFKYQEFQMDNSRYFNKGMIWVDKTYTLTSPRLHKIKELIKEGKLRKVQ